MIVIKNTKAMQFNPPKVWNNVDVVVDGTDIIDVGPGQTVLILGSGVSGLMNIRMVLMELL